jgi:hypothetical protein
MKEKVKQALEKTAVYSVAFLCLSVVALEILFLLPALPFMYAYYKLKGEMPTNKWEVTRKSGFNPLTEKEKKKHE